LNYKDLNLRKITLKDLIDLYTSGELILTKKDTKLLQNDIVTAVINGTFPVALNTIALGLMASKTETLEIIRRKALFRYSQYRGRKCIVENLSIALLSFLKDSQIHDKKLTMYLESLIKLEYLHKEYSRLHNEIIANFNTFEQNYPQFSLLKTLIAHVDHKFLQQVVPHPNAKGLMNSIYSRSKEELSSATSYCIHLLTTLIPSSMQKGSMVAAEYITSNKIYDLLLPAALIEDYKELELLVEHYGYYVEKIGNDYELLPPTPNFERDIRMGFIRTETQSMNTGMSFVRWLEGQKDILSMEVIVDEFIGIEDFIKFEFVGRGLYPRYRILMPDFAYKVLNEKLFDAESLLAEEAYHFAWITGEQLLTFDSLKTIKISDNLRLIDFLMLNRYFIFMHMVYEHFFKSIEKIDEAHLLHSIVPQLSNEHLDMMFDGFANQKMIDEFFDVVCWEPLDEGLFDLQYQPIIFVNDQYLVPFHIMAQMNVLRNLYASEYKKGNKNLLLNGANDPLANRLSKVLTKAGIENQVDLDYGKGDIDVVAILEDTLIFIECKHSLHPGDLYELRRTYDYVQKAEIQLDRAKDHLENKDLIKNIEGLFKRPLKDSIKNVLTLIVTSNRILSGNNFSHPVRDINDLDNFITRGTFSTNDGIFSLYKGERFNLSELKDYILNDNIAVNHMREVLISYDQIFRSPYGTLKYTTYYTDMVPALKALQVFTSGLQKVGDHKND
jgi:hypothetical protein